MDHGFQDHEALGLELAKYGWSMPRRPQASQARVHRDRAAVLDRMVLHAIRRFLDSQRPLESLMLAYDD